MLLAIGNSLADFDPNILSTRLLAAPRHVNKTRCTALPLSLAMLSARLPAVAASVGSVLLQLRLYSTCQNPCSSLGPVCSNQGATAWMVVSSAMVVCMIIWREQGYMVGITTVVLGCKAVWDLWRGHRYYRTHVNAGCVALLSSLMWAGLMVFVMGLVQTPSTGITIAMIVGIPVAFAGGYVWLRYQARRGASDGSQKGRREWCLKRTNL